MAHARIDRQRGTVLIVVTAAVAIIFLAVLAKSAMQDIERKFRIQTAADKNLTTIETALANFVAQNRRLPCPADGTIASGVVNAGVESRTAATGVCVPANQRNGVVPWVTLGISEKDASDPWNGRITYRVPAAFAGNTNLADMTGCDAAGAPTGASGAALGCPVCPAGTGATCMNPLNYLYSKGLQVQDGTGAWLNNPSPAWVAAPVPPPPASTGAAYVLISHGPTGAGAYNHSGILQPGSVAAGTNELPNRANQTLTGATIFIDALQDTSQTAAHFDDILRHPTIQSVLTSVALGPRSHP